MKRLFITGGTGFVGSNFLNAAYHEGYEVLALRRKPDSRPRVPLNFEPHWVDSSLEELCPSDFEGVDAVIHLAAQGVLAASQELETCLHQNVIAPLSMMRAAIAGGVERFVIAGSYFEYGDAGERYEFIPTNAPLEATSSYSASKAAASIAFGSLAVETGVRVSLHRLFQVYGPGESESRLWPSIRSAAENGENFECSPGQQVRDFIHVDDVVQQLLEAIDDPDCQSGRMLIRNVGSGVPQTLKNFVEYWWSAFGARGRVIFGAKPYRIGETMRCVPEVAK